MANDDNESVLHFKCDSCGIHLGVDSSLAGQEAPCPKCGKILQAPSLDEQKEATMAPLTIPSADSGGTLRRRKRRRSDEYSGRRSDPTEPTVNYKKLFQIVLFISIVALIALAVTWYLQNH